jgi:hypothetical protein
VLAVVEISMYRDATHSRSDGFYKVPLLASYALNSAIRGALCNNTCLKLPEPYRTVFRSIYTLAITKADLTALPASAMPNKDIKDMPEPTQEDKEYAKNWKGKEKQKRLRALIKEAGMVVNSRGPINAGYAPIMKLIDEVRLMAT